MDSAQEWVSVGWWAPCSGGDGSCAWSERWESVMPRVELTFSTADNRRPPQRTTCPFSEVLTDDGLCVCDDGFELGSDGRQCAASHQIAIPFLPTHLSTTGYLLLTTYYLLLTTHYLLLLNGRSPLRHGPLPDYLLPLITYCSLPSTHYPLLLNGRSSLRDGDLFQTAEAQ